MGSFSILTSKPSKSDPYIYLYNNYNNGGKSLCINGKPTDSTCNVLSNCVGWSCGRFNHIYNLLTGNKGIKYPKFCCNAENFIEVAKAYGLTISQTPQPGAIMVWQKGATLKHSDGAGHVAIVEKVNSPTQVFTSESGYNSYVFANRTRNKGTNSNWGAGTAYKFRGFILNPAVKVTSTTSKPVDSSSSVPNPVSRDNSKNQINVIISDLRIRTTPSTSGKVIGMVKPGYYNYSKKTQANGYTWYAIGDDKWVAYKDSWVKVLPAKSETKSTNTSNLKVGDLVKIASNATIYGTSSKFASWVYDTNLYVRSISNNKITISTNKTGEITGSTDRKYIIKK